MNICRTVLLASLVCVLGCSMAGRERSTKKEDKLLFAQAQKALNARDFVDAIELLQIFIERFPESDGYPWALQRLGESFEGLIEVEYVQPVQDGVQEPDVRSSFMETYGHFGCWEESPDGIRYDLSHYRKLLEAFPDCPIADEAAFRSIRWEKKYGGRPEGILRELDALEDVLARYPSTSFRPEILYKMAYRCHVLYEIYLLSGNSGIRDRGLAEQYRSKTLYLYKLVLKTPDHSAFSEKAWQGMQALESGKTIYRMP